MLALFSCFDKSKAAVFAKELTNLNYQIIASHGTYKHLASKKIKTRSIESITSFSQLLDGRVKTLNTNIFAAILADKTKKQHLLDLKNHNLEPFDLVYVDLYPFKKTVASKMSNEQIIEMIDIGGVGLIRAAAKNYKNVITVSSDTQITVVIDAIKNSKVDDEFRKNLAKEAFQSIANYDLEIAKWFCKQTSSTYSNNKLDNFSFVKEDLSKSKDLRYGENPHQMAAIYSNKSNNDCYKEVFGLQTSYLPPKQVQKNTANNKTIKELSYNNILDAKHAYKLVIEIEKSFDKNTPHNTLKNATKNICAIIKHNNPCGCAVANTQTDAFSAAHKADDISAFGGLCAFNKVVSAQTAKLICKHFFEVIIAPKFASDALKIFGTKKNLRLIAYNKEDFNIPFDIQSIPFGYLCQNTDNKVINQSDLTFVAKSDNNIKNLLPFLFAWQIAKSANSNAIVIIGINQQSFVSLGIGLGQTNRLLAAKIATDQLRASKLYDSSYKLYAASDGFFPFTDGLQQLVDNNILNIIQPAGSINDPIIINYAKQNKLNLIFTNFRHFKH